jgi:hypothetical protein
MYDVKVSMDMSKSFVVKAYDSIETREREKKGFVIRK